MNRIEVEPHPNPEYEQVLRSDFPELEIQDMKHIGSGWHSAAMLVNNDWVFRFPRHLFDTENITGYEMSQIRREPAVLSKLHGRIPYQTPVP